MQLPLFSEPFEPITDKLRNYVPALQTKKGELDALHHVPAADWTGITPLVQVLGPKTPKDELTHSAVAGWTKKIYAAVKGNPCFLDVVRLKPQHPVSHSKRQLTAIDYLHAAARKRDVKFVPVFRPELRSDVYIRTIRNSIDLDGRGLAIRLSAASFLPPNESIEKYLHRVLAEFDVNPDQVDIFYDFSYMDPETERRSSRIAKKMREVVDAGDWRNFIMLGTTMPSTLSCISEGTVGELPRLEWELWSELGSHGIGRALTFGDYAVQHPKPPSKGGPGMRANIRYTSDGKTIVARGRGPFTDEGKVQYHELCEKLRNHPEFRGASYSWGDSTIDECADGLIEPGGQDVWRGAGTSHHLKIVTEMLSTSLP